MAERSLITPELCRQLLHYEPGTGKLFWLPRPASMYRDNEKWSAAHAAAAWNAKWAGREAFTCLKDGYGFGSILGHPVKAHRVCWAIAHGRWPEGLIDHENGVRSDNRLKNLSDVTHLKNCTNRGKDRRNKTGIMGVRWVARRQAWEAHIGVSGKQKFLGLFTTFDAAAHARRAAEKRYGFHPNHGRARD